MLITSLKQTTSEKITVCFEDGSEVNSTLGVVTDMRLYSGKDLNDEEIGQLKFNSSKYLALGKAADLLSRRMMSRKELRDKLIQKGYEEPIAEFCAEKLTEVGLINDEDYANAIVRHYYAKSYGAAKIRHELYRRGISRELSEYAMESIPDSSDKLDSYIQKHLPDKEDKKQLNKVVNALFRRGYSWEEINAAISRYD